MELLKRSKDIYVVDAEGHLDLEMIEKSMEQKIKVVKLFTEGMGIRWIERVENIPSSLIVHWIRGLSKMLKAKLCATEIPAELKEIEILEMDELFTYYQKKVKKPMFGLLWTEIGIKLLIL